METLESASLGQSFKTSLTATSLRMPPNGCTEVPLTDCLFWVILGGCKRRLIASKVDSVIH